MERLEIVSASTTSSEMRLQAELSDLRSQTGDSGHLDRANGSETFAARLDELDRGLQELRDHSNRRLNQLRQELDRSHAVHEQQRRRLDKLYVDSNTENELLYDRYNSELLKLFQDGQSRNVDTTVAKLQEAHSEAKKLRRENQKLRRENILLKAEIGV